MPGIDFIDDEWRDRDHLSKLVRPHREQMSLECFSCLF